MKRQSVLSLVPALSLALAACSAPEAPDIHHDSIVVDSHNDVLQRMIIEGADIRNRLEGGHSDLPRLREGGMDVVFFSVWPDPIYRSDRAAHRSLEQIDSLYQLLSAAPDRIELATTASEVRRIVGQGKLAALMGLEGGHGIENDLGLLRTFHRLGVRYLTLTHVNTNDWADSSGDVAKSGGLSPFGEDVVREMNKIGMIVDISHVSDETFWDVMRITKRPVIASHSACRALANTPRNMSDEMIKAVGKNGGVIGIIFYPMLLDQGYLNKKLSDPGNVFATMKVPPDLDTSRLDEFARERYMTFAPQAQPKGKPKIPLPPLEVVADHIDHVVKLAGVDHVGIGSDYDGMDVTPAGLEDVAYLPDLTKVLLKRGYSDQDIRKILGENFLRVLREVTGS